MGLLRGEKGVCDSDDDDGSFMVDQTARKASSHSQMVVLIVCLITHFDA